MLGERRKKRALNTLTEQRVSLVVQRFGIQAQEVASHATRLHRYAEQNVLERSEWYELNRKIGIGKV